MQIPKILGSTPPNQRRKLFRRLAALAGLGITGVLLSQEKTGLFPEATAGGTSGTALIIDEGNQGGSTTTLLSGIQSGAAFLVHATATSGNPSGVFGQSDGPGATGVYGVATVTTGPAYGVFGLVFSAGGTGVYAVATATTGTPVGVLGATEGVTPYLAMAGVQGAANTGTGVQGESVSGIGVYGNATSSTGSTQGVFGQSNSTSGFGVYGFAGASTGSTYGVYGTADSPTGICVLGQAGNAGTIPLVAQGASGQTSPLQEWKNSSGVALNVVDPNGNVGIGTASPTDPLTVSVGGSVGGSADLIGMQGSAAGATRSLAVDTSSEGLATNVAARINFIADGVYGAHIAFASRTGSIGTSTTEIMRIATNGNVGIHTNAPLNSLDVVGAVAVGTYAGVNTAPSNGLIVSGNVGIGTTSPSQALTIVGGSIQLDNAQQVYTKTSAGVSTTLFATDSSNNCYFGSPQMMGNLALEAGGGIVFYTGGGYQRGYIDSAGRFVMSVQLGLGVIPNHLIQLSGGAYSDGTTWNPASSIRWKENITPLTNSVETIKQLHPVAYNYKKTPEKRTMGFIAEEVGKVLPTVVDWDSKEEGYAEGYDQTAIIALAVEAVKEQQKTIEQQQAQIGTMHEEIRTLQDAVKRLNADVPVSS